MTNVLDKIKKVLNFAETVAEEFEASSEKIETAFEDSVKADFDKLVETATEVETAFVTTIRDSFAKYDGELISAERKLEALLELFTNIINKV